MLLVFLGCSSSSDPEVPNWSELVEQGWSAFRQGQYQVAVERFSEAESTDPSESEAYSGLGWSLFRLDRLSEASVEFSSGSGKDDPSADLFAGWAFVLNAQKDHSTSNSKVVQALAVDVNWRFPHDTSLDTVELHVLKAENHFLLGEFSESLAEVQLLNATFSADITTSQGQSSLAAEIERLRSIS
jgi:tetratricopeptide (TPR) repeat protein